MRDNFSYPRVLVVANNSFSLTNSNGRTLGNFFRGWPKDSIAQFCVSTTTPDYDLCDNYYILPDQNVIDAFVHFRKGCRGDITQQIDTAGNTRIGGKRVFKTPWKALIRHIVWNKRIWNSKEFQQWVNSFDPQVVLLMNSDATFILDIATQISIDRNIPLVIFNTEGYYLFKHCFYRKSLFFSDTIFTLYKRIYCRQFRKTMSHVKLCIYGNSKLKEDYDREFNCRSVVLYTGSTLKFDSFKLDLSMPKFTYLGNFGFDRPTALIEIANVLQSINPDFKLDIYGNIPRPEVELKFKACSGIVFHGMVPYDEVTRVMYQSTILFHAEAQNKRLDESLQYGFSTKIADSIASGHPFLMYSSPSIAGAKYIIETGAGWHAKNKDELKQQIIVILSDEFQRNKVLAKAKEVSLMNHSIDTIVKKFHENLLSVTS